MRLFIGITALLLLCFANTSFAQVGVMNLDEIQRIKDGTTYIVMKDTGSPASQPYKDIFRKYWTISKFKFINDTDMDNHIELNAAFFTMHVFHPVTYHTMYTPTGYSTMHNNTAQNAAHENMNGTTLKVTGSFLYLLLWNYDEDYFKRKKKKDPTSEDEVKIGRVDLFADYKTLVTPDSIFYYNYDWAGHIRNWGPGFLKNYLQQLMIYLNGKKEVYYEKDDFTNKSEMAHLQTATLYIPDYTLTRYDPHNGNESQKTTALELFKEYHFPHKLISTQELNDKILNSTEPFYYLVYVKDCENKLVTIINSQTGEIVYSNYTKYSYNIKPSDFDDLNSVVKHSK
ncbi:MAG TPA: hypothetical protein VK806_11910 [Bacteroidia bacterium]|nr:hypothetical protein [Bacteroidia bacterium]